MRQRTRRTVALAIFTGLATAAHAVIIPPTQPRFSWDAGAPGGNTGQWQAHIGGPKPLKFAQGGGATAPSRVLAPSALPGITAAYAFDGAADNCVSSTGNDNFFQNVGITDKDTTFELWVRPTSLSGGEQVLFESGGGVDGMSFLLDDDTLKWRVKDGGEARTLTFTVPDPAAIADFNQVVGVYDRDTGGKDVITLYLNGNNVVATDASNNNLNDWAGGNATGIASVGSGVGGTDNGDIDSFGTLDGQVAIVRVYDQALDGAAVQEAYEAVTSSTLQPRAGRFTANQNPTTATYPPFDGPEAGGDAIGFTTSLTYAGTQDGVARNNFVRDGALSAFFDESKSQDGSHAVEDFGYVVASPALPVGEIRVDDWGGLKCLRGTATVNDNAVTVTFPQSFDAMPVVLADMITIAGTDPSYVRVFDVSEDGFSMQIDETEFDNAGAGTWGHADETVAWLAVEEGAFDFGDGFRGEAHVVDRETLLAVGPGHTDSSRFTAVTFDQAVNPNLSALVGNLYFGDNVFDTDPSPGDGIIDAFAGWRIQNFTASGFQFAAENPLAFDDGDFANAPYFAYMVVSIPEPGTVSLLGLGALALLRRRRRRG